LRSREGLSWPEVPGWLTVEEGRLLWQQAAGRRVLELGTASGRATVCLGQQARPLVSIDPFDQTEAREWVRCSGLADRVEFVQGEVEASCRNLHERFDLVLVDTDHDTPSVQRDID
jgi:predicted O-methyltransferase YrrM